MVSVSYFFLIFNWFLPYKKIVLGHVNLMLKGMFESILYTYKYINIYVCVFPPLLEDHKFESWIH